MNGVKVVGGVVGKVLCIATGVALGTPVGSVGTVFVFGYLTEDATDKRKKEESKQKQ